MVPGVCFHISLFYNFSKGAVPCDIEIQTNAAEGY